MTNNVAQLTGTQNVMLIKLASMNVPNGHTVQLRGDKPVVFLVSGSATVDGLVHANASGTGTSGAGGDQGCTSAMTGTAGTNGGAGGGGGGGGAFGQGGGNGGSGDAGAIAGGIGGAAHGASSLVPLRGGCSGANGGRGLGYERARRQGRRCGADQCARQA